MRLHPAFLLRCALVALPLAMTACADFDLFDEKKTPLPGDRKPMFPAGVPGVNYNSPPMQPTNSNIPIDTQISAAGQSGQAAQPGENEKDQPAAQSKSRATRNSKQGQPQPPPRAVAQPAGPADPWGDSRTPN